MLPSTSQIWAVVSQYWIVPTGMIALYYYGAYHFNSPDYPIEQGASAASGLEQARLLSLAPPAFTTYRVCYRRYALVYVLILEVAFILLVFFSGLVVLANQAASGGEATKAFGEATKTLVSGNLETRALLALFALTGVLSSFPHVKNIDEWILKKLHQAALIPHEATLLAERLYAAEYEPTTMAAVEVRKDLKLRDTQRVADHKATGSLEERLLRMLWLRSELNRMINGPKYARFNVALARDIREVLMVSASLRQDVRTYFLDQERLVPEAENDIDDCIARKSDAVRYNPELTDRDAILRLTERRDLLKAKCSSIYYRLCLIAALMVVATAHSSADATTTLQKLGFVFPRENPPYVENWHAAAIVLLATALLIVALNVAIAFGIWEGGINIPDYTDRIRILVYSLSEAAAYGVAMGVAIIGKRSIFALGNFVIAATTFLISAALYYGLQVSLGHLLTIGPALFALAPAVVGYFLGVYIERARKSQPPTIRLAGLQTFCQVAVTLIAAGFAPPPNLTMLQGLTLDCSAALEAGVIGLVIGVLFQRLYR